MTKEAFDRAVIEAKDFLERAKSVKWNHQDGLNGYWYTIGSVESAALKRQSMELTRALAKLRKP